MTIRWSTRGGLLQALAPVSVLVILQSVLAGASWANTQAGDGVTFRDHAQFAVGFDPDDPDFPTGVDYLLDPETPWVGAKSTDSSWTPDVPVSFELDSCLLLATSTGCEDMIAEGEAYSVEVTLTLLAAEGAPSTGFLLFLSGLNENLEEGASAPAPPVYDVDAVRVLTDAPGMDEFEVIKWTNLSGTTELFYLGWFFDEFDAGTTQSVKFRYDVTSQLADGTPVFRANGAYVFVPEPGTALLLGVGLTGLAIRRRRGR